MIFFVGQFVALNQHSLTSHERETLKTATFPILAITGDKVDWCILIANFL